jgi:predicted permease
VEIFPLSSILQDLRYALRNFARTPGVTLLAVATLAVGVGAIAAIFSVVHSVLIEPLPYPHADRVVIPWRHNPRLGDVSVSPSRADVDEWQKAEVFEAMLTYTRSSVVLSGGDEPEPLSAVMVDTGFFDFTGANPQIGRRFSLEEHGSEAAGRVVLLTHDLWRRRFGGDRAAVGKRVELTDRSYEIVGVLPSSFRMPLGKADVVMPLPPAPAPVPGAKVTRAPVVSALARLRPAMSLEVAQQQLTAAGVETFGGSPGWGVRLMRPTETTARSFRRGLMVLFGAVGFVLLIACANVANIVLARNAARGREIAVRAALGAGRRRLVQQLLTENLVLAALGGAAGIALGVWGLEAIAALRPADMRELEGVRLSWQMFAFGLGVAAVTGAAFGLFPAFAGTRRDAAEALRQGGRSAGDARGRMVRRALSVAEVALALVLLAGAGLLIRSYGRLQSADLGFNPRHLISVNVGLPEARYPTQASQASFFKSLADQVRQLPGVRYAALATGLPPMGGLVFGQIDIEGRSMSDTEKPGAFGGGWVSPGYFEAMGIPVREGRGFIDDDMRSDSNALLINDVMARRYWPGELAVGKRLRLNPKAPWSTIIGVVGTVKSGHDDTGRLQMYYPLTESSMFPDTSLLVSTSADVNGTVSLIKGQVWSLDAKLPVKQIATIEQRVAETLARPRFNVVLLTIFAGIGLLLAAIGIYGVISYSVGLRTREIGLRMALGAVPADIRRAVLGEALVLAGIGTALGLAGAWALARVMTTLLYEVSATDPATLASVALVLALSAVIAAWLPARRAMRVDPMVALRAE